MLSIITANNFVVFLAVPLASVTTTISSDEVTPHVNQTASSSRPYITTTPPSGGTHGTIVSQTFFIIAGAALIGIAGILAVLFLVCVCVRRLGKTQPPTPPDPVEPGIS